MLNAVFENYLYVFWKRYLKNLFAKKYAVLLLQRSWIRCTLWLTNIIWFVRNYWSWLSCVGDPYLRIYIPTNIPTNVCTNICLTFVCNYYKLATNEWYPHEPEQFWPTSNIDPKEEKWFHSIYVVFFLSAVNNIIIIYVFLWAQYE